MCVWDFILSSTSRPEEDYLNECHTTAEHARETASYRRTNHLAPITRRRMGRRGGRLSLKVCLNQPFDKTALGGMLCAKILYFGPEFSLVTLPNRKVA